MFHVDFNLKPHMNRHLDKYIILLTCDRKNFHWTIHAKLLLQEIFHLCQQCNYQEGRRVVAGHFETSYTCLLYVPLISASYTF